MNRKCLVSLLLVLLLFTGLLPSAALAEEAGEPFPAAREETSRPSRLVSLRVIGTPVTIADEAGNVILPREEASGVQSYLLQPGTYSYAAPDGNGVRIERFTIDGLEREVELNPAELSGEGQALPESSPLPGTAEPDPAGETLLMPVVLEGAENPRALTVLDLAGAVLPPYTDETGEIHHGCYLLPPGDYRYHYRDGEDGVEAEGDFAVDGSGMQTITLTLPEKPVSFCFSATAINPYYANLITESAIPTPGVTPEESLRELQGELSRVTHIDTASPVIYDNPEMAGAAIKRGLLQRQREIGIRIKCGIKPTDSNWRELCWMLYDIAVRHTGAPTEGDYLRYEYGGVTCSGCSLSIGEAGEYYYSFVYAPLYFTSFAQEAELSARVAALLGELPLAGKSEEGKIRVLYQYLSGHVDYDYTEGDPIVFTAYDALVNGRAACQGVAAAFYRLCLELGLDARIVTSTGMGHAWNIVRADGRHYYALDATWETGEGPADWEYYLKGRENWLATHELGDEFLNGAFDYAFPDADYGAEHEAVIHQVSVLFDGMLRIKYYFALPERLLEDPGAVITFSRGGETFLETPLSAYREEGEYCCFYCGVSADALSTPVQARIFDGGGNPVQIGSRSGTTYPNGFFFSAMDYARGMQSPDVNASGTMRALARALEDYGTAAENFFRHSGESLREAVRAVTLADLDPWSASTEGERPAGFSGAAVSAMFEADNGLRVYLQFESGADLGRYSFAVDGSEAVLNKKSDGTFYLAVENIAADALDTPHRFTISDGTDSYTVVTSVLGYARTAIERGSEDMANLARALFLYNRAAEAYFGG